MSQPPNSDMDLDLLACLIGLSLSTHHSITDNSASHVLVIIKLLMLVCYLTVVQYLTVWIFHDYIVEFIA